MAGQLCSSPGARAPSAASRARRCGRRPLPPRSRREPSRSAPMLGAVATELKPAYLLFGSDRPKITRALRRLRDRIGDDATEQLTAREATGDDAVAACNALGLFVGEGRLVV